MELKIVETFFYRINGEKSMADLYLKFNTDTVVRNNPSINLYNGEWVKIKVNNYISHFVKPTENLTKIAEFYKIDKDKLIADNKLKGEKLFIGQLLRIFN